MGKFQKKKSMRRHNPVRVPDTHLSKGLVSAEQSSSKNAAILPILQKVWDPVPMVHFMVSDIEQCRVRGFRWRVRMPWRGNGPVSLWPI